MTNQAYTSGYERIMEKVVAGKHIFINGTGAGCFPKFATFKIVIGTGSATLYHIKDQDNMIRIDKRSGDWYHHFQRYLDSQHGIEI